jgi:predicted acetyltransferase
VPRSPSPLAVVSLPEDDIGPMLEVGYHAFLRRPPAERKDQEAYRRFLAGAERLGVRDGDDLIGVSAALPSAITVPGGAALPCSCITWVAVLPTHRRRGVLRSMMNKHLDAAGAADRPLAALWASEAAIYGRFGFGAGAATTGVELDTSRPLPLRVAPNPEPPRLVEPAGAAAVIGPIYERLRRPGMLTRTAAWWNEQTLYTGDEWADKELTDARVVIIGDAGYAIYRTRPGDDDEDRPGAIEVQELIAEDAATEAALWSFLASIDLTRSLRAWNRPTDDLLPLLLADADRAKRTATFTTLWIRVVDIAKAMARRTWAADVDLSLAVTDELVPDNAGTWRLQARGGTAALIRLDAGAAPDLALDIRELGTAYLGGTPVAHLVAAGLVTEHAPGAAIALDAALRTPWAPFLGDEF